MTTKPHSAILAHLTQVKSILGKMMQLEATADTKAPD